MPFSVDRSTGSASAFHAREIPDPLTPTVWVLEVDRPAVVLGSTQPDDVVDVGRAAAAGFEIVRRRSGGGAVLLEPGEALWVDVLLPRAHPRWHDDVGRAVHWLGDVWGDALRAVDGHRFVDASTHCDGMVASEWSKLVCFAGRGPGEVFVDDRKVVGISQRRTRVGARFQCAVYREWRPDRLLDLLALSPTDREWGEVALSGVASGVGDRLGELTSALTEHLAG